MGSSPPSLFLLLLLLFVLNLPTSNATLHRAKLLTSEFSAGRRPSSPTTYFELTRPIPLPKTKPCSTLVLQHDFGDTYSKPPVTALYKPPSHCPLHRPPSTVVLEWTAACRGRQFDRIFGIWLGGVEFLHSCTVEPRATGIIWTVKKDVTRYTSLFAQPHTLAVYLRNLIDQTYTGVYHVNVSLHFFFDSSTHHRPPTASPVPIFTSLADLVLPISRSLPSNGGLWFPVQNSSDFLNSSFFQAEATEKKIEPSFSGGKTASRFELRSSPAGFLSSGEKILFVFDVGYRRRRGRGEKGKRRRRKERKEKNKNGGLRRRL